MTHATAAGVAAGVSTADIASGEKGSIVCHPGAIVPVESTGTIAAGDEVEVGTAGVAAVLSAGIAVGIAMSGATGGADAEIRLY